jgi:hypothetical protein
MKKKHHKKIKWSWNLSLSRAENISRIRKQKIKQIIKIYGEYIPFSELN